MAKKQCTNHVLKPILGLGVAILIFSNEEVGKKLHVKRSSKLLTVRVLCVGWSKLSLLPESLGAKIPSLVYYGVVPTYSSAAVATKTAGYCRKRLPEVHMDGP